LTRTARAVSARGSSARSGHTRTGEPQPTVNMPIDDPNVPHYDLKKEKTHIITPDVGSEDNVHLANHIRLTVDHNLQEKLAVTDPNTISALAPSAALKPPPNPNSYRFKAEVPGWNHMRFKSKDCKLGSSDKISATRNVKDWPSWLDDHSIDDNIRLQKSACLENDYASLGGFCFNEKDLDGPWCYWPRMDCEIPEKQRINAAHLVLDYPAYGSSKQKESCQESGFCYENGARPACYLPRV